MKNYFEEMKVYKNDESKPYSFIHLKRDGWAVQFSKNAKGEIQCITRTPSIITSKQDWFVQLCDFVPKSTVLIGELFVEGGTSTDVRSVICKDPKFLGTFEYFSVPLLSGEDFRKADITEIPRFLEGLKQIDLYGYNTLDTLPENIPEGYEGYVLKMNQFPLYPYDWMKWKPEQTVDLRVTGFTDAKEGKFYGRIGAVICQTDDGKIKTQISGMSDSLRTHMTDYKSWWIGKVIEVRYQFQLRSGSLRHPQYVRVREDKITTD